MNSKNKIVENLINLFIGLAGVVVATFLVVIIRGNFDPPKEDERLERIERTTEEIKKTIVPYEYKESLKKITVVRNFNNTTKNGEITNYFTKRLITQGEFNRGFINVRASVNNSPLKPSESVYAKLGALVNGQYKEFGGHLISSRSLETPTSQNWTELLYDLSDIKYKNRHQDSDIEVISGNWLTLLNSGNNQSVIGFISTVSNGEIIELSLYYECSPSSSCEIKLD